MGFQTDARRIMNRAGFDGHKVKLALIWAAKWKRCPKCEEPIGKGCINLTKKRQGMRELTAYPHDARIDWEMLVVNLQARGMR
jgi:hypothetical protein